MSKSISSKKILGFNTLKVLLQSLKFQLSELNETNKKIDLKSKSRGLRLEEKEEK